MRRRRRKEEEEEEKQEQVKIFKKLKGRSGGGA